MEGNRDSNQVKAGRWLGPWQCPVREACRALLRDTVEVSAHSEGASVEGTCKEHKRLKSETWNCLYSQKWNFSEFGDILGDLFLLDRDKIWGFLVALQVRFWLGQGLQWSTWGQLSTRSCLASCSPEPSPWGGDFQTAMSKLKMVSWNLSFDTHTTPSSEMGSYFLSFQHFNMRTF